MVYFASQFVTVRFTFVILGNKLLSWPKTYFVVIVLFAWGIDENAKEVNEDSNAITGALSKVYIH